MTINANTLYAPWSLWFDRDGTEDFGIVVDCNGKPIVSSRECQTCWLPEAKSGTVPDLVHQLQLMASAPRLLAALTDCVRLLADYDEDQGEEGDVYREGIAAICEATGRIA